MTSSLFRSRARPLPQRPVIFLLGMLFAFAMCAPLTTAQSVALVPRDVEFHFDGVDFASDGFLYFGGSWKGGAVYRSTLDGQVEVYARGFDGPTDTVMDSRGNVYVSNYNSTTISVITPEREVRTFAEVLQGPAGLAIDGDDNIYCTIYGLPVGDGNSLLRITPEGEVSTYLQTPDIQAAVGLAIDDQGVLYIANGHDGRIFRVPEAGSHELMASLPLTLGRGAGGHLDWAGGNLFASSGIGVAYLIMPNGTLHSLLQHGDERTALGPLVSPLMEGCNGLAASPDGRSLFLGCAPGGERRLVRLDLDGAAPGSRLSDGWEALKAGDLERAENIFTTLSEVDAPIAGVFIGLGAARYRRGDFSRAAEAFDRAAGRPGLKASERASAAYNGACAHALAGDVGRAFDALDRAIAAGYQDVANLQADKDLASLRTDPRWADLVDRVRAARSL